MTQSLSLLIWPGYWDVEHSDMTQSASARCANVSNKSYLTVGARVPFLRFTNHWQYLEKRVVVVEKGNLNFLFVIYLSCTRVP